MTATPTPILAPRDLQTEWMDLPDLDSEMHRQALAGLARINWWTRADRVLWKRMRDVAQRIPGPIRVLDVGCGGGDVLRSLARRAWREQLVFQWTGCDVSPVAVDLARRDASAAGLDEIRYAQRDVFAEEPLPACDVVMCTLFLHHLTASHAELLVRRMATAATRLVLIDDLVRTRDGYLLAWVGSRILSRSPVVHADGPQSVRAAFSLSELQQIAKQSGLDGATIERHWPQRMLLTWERPA